jgi:hypothetical protein
LGGGAACAVSIGLLSEGLNDELPVLWDVPVDKSVLEHPANNSISGAKPNHLGIGFKLLIKSDL